MKVWVLVITFAVLGSNLLLAQTESLESSTARQDAVLYDQLVPLDNPKLGSVLTPKKRYRIAGPLAHAFQSRKEVPRRLLQLVNPFARSEPKAAENLDAELSPRAWSTTVGWSTGGSGFQNPVTHESQLGLISVSRTRAP